MLALSMSHGGAGSLVSDSPPPLDPQAMILSDSGLEPSMDIGLFLGADRFYNAGITGQNTIGIIIEAGHVWSGHQALGHVETFFDASEDFPGSQLGDFDWHATMTGHVVGGRGPLPQQRGIAFGANLESGAIATGWTSRGGFSITSESFADPYLASFGRVDVINSSWGFSEPTGFNTYAALADALAREHPTTLSVASAGNSGPSGNTVGGLAAGYNGISVGATAAANNYDTVAVFSSRGPNDYQDSFNGLVLGVRSAVDILAPGTDVLMAFYGGLSGGNREALPGSELVEGDDLYRVADGTSFSGPMVAGGALLLSSTAQELGFLEEARDSRVIKAVLLNSADKLAGWNNGQNLIDGVVRTSQALDWSQGAGQMNLGTAWDQYVEGQTGLAGVGGGPVAATGWDLGRLLDVGDSNSYVIEELLLAGWKLTATLAYFRNYEFEAATGDIFDVGMPFLTLEVWDGAFQTLYAISESLYSGTQHLALTLPVDGEYAVRVSYEGRVFGFAETEEYGLAWATAIPEPGTYALWLGMVLLLGAALRRAPVLGRSGGRSPLT